MKPHTTRAFLTLSVLAFICLFAVSQTTPAPNELVNPFFVFEDGLGSSVPETEAALAEKVGFAGISFDDAKLVPERLKAIDQHHLQFFFIYLAVDVSGQEPVYEPGFDQAISLLRGRNTVIWLTIRGHGPRAEELAVEAARRTSDLASAANLRVALYPHHAFYVETLSDAIRIADKAGRSNLGYTFNLCHELRSSALDADLQLLQKTGVSRLYAVSVNGADAKGTDWDTLIQPLDRGNVDVAALLQRITSYGYRGPVGLQCYAIKEDPEAHLRRSMALWRKWSNPLPALRAKGINMEHD